LAIPKSTTINPTYGKRPDILIAEEKIAVTRTDKFLTGKADPLAGRSYGPIFSLSQVLNHLNVNSNMRECIISSDSLIKECQEKERDD
jgi:hypothetical protein